MKKILFILMITVFPAVSAHDITTSWPYIYPDFVNGTVYYAGGEKTEALMNIHLLRSKLHYLDNNTIKEVKNTDILVVEIGSDKYCSFNNQMLKVIDGNQNSFLGELVTVNMASLNETEGAYGSSSNSSATRKLSSLDIAGNGYNTSHIELLNSKESGKLLSISKKYYVVASGEIYLATKKGIESKLSAEKKNEFKVFLKANRIKWRTADSLVKLLDFFHE